MKVIPGLQNRAVAALLGLALAGSASTALAVTDFVLSTFDVDLTGTADGGGVPKTMVWSPVNASGGAAGSGSMYVEVGWSNAPAGGWQDSKINFNPAWPGAEAVNYVNVEFDVKVNATNAPAAVNGTYGGIQVIVQGYSGWGSDGTNAYYWNPLGTVTLDATNIWQHKKMALGTYNHNLSQLVLNAFVNPGTNTVAFWLDNVMFTAPPQPPPTLSLQPNTSVPGLEVIAGPSGDYPRQNIRTWPTNEMTWVGRPGTVTYSMTIGNYPPTNYSGFQAHMMLVPNAAGSSSPDWDYPNAMCLFVNNDSWALPKAAGYLRFKTNSAAANAMMYQGPNTNGLPVGNPTNAVADPIGTWSLAFSQDTNVTVTGPGGVVATATLTPDQAALFASGVVFYVGNQPNGAAKNGQFTTFTSVDVTGVASGDIHDTFTSFNANLWDKSTAASPSGILIIDPTDKYVLGWTIPDNGFTELQASTNVAGGWTDSTIISQAFPAGNGKKIVVKAADLPSPNTGYFRLLKRVASKLQILLPGETAAPGTPSGKMGTPLAQTNGAPFTITVNACDNNWVVVTSVSDQVHLTSTDGFATLGDFGLANGTGTQSVMFNDSSYPGNPGAGGQGGFTITASDLTDPAKASSTSTAVYSY